MDVLLEKETFSSIPKKASRTPLQKMEWTCKEETFQFKKEHLPFQMARSSVLTRRRLHLGPDGLTTIFIKGFDTESYSANDTFDEIRATFEECGEITRLKLPKDYESGMLRGFGYIDFATVEAKVSESKFSLLKK